MHICKGIHTSLMTTADIATFERIVASSTYSVTAKHLAYVFNNCSEHVNLFDLNAFPQEFLEILLAKINIEKTLKYVNISGGGDVANKFRYVLENLTSIAIESIVVISRTITQESIDAIKRFVYVSKDTLKHISFNFTGTNGLFGDGIDILELLQCVQTCTALERLSFIIPRTTEHVIVMANIVLLSKNLKQLRLRFSAELPSLVLYSDYSDCILSLLSDAIINHECINDIDFNTFSATDDEITMIQEIMKGNKRITEWSLCRLDSLQIDTTIAMCDHITTVHLDALNPGTFWQLLECKHITTLEFYNLHNDEIVNIREYIESVVVLNTTLLDSQSLINFSPKCEEALTRNNKILAVEKLIEIVPELHRLGMSVWVIYEIVNRLMPKHDAITRHFIVKACGGIIRSIESVEDAKL